MAVIRARLFKHRTKGSAGEKAGDLVALGSFWARVSASPEPGSDEYEVEDADGLKRRVARKELRHRKTVTEAHVGITADPTHDSYSMRSFVGSFLKDLRGRGVITDQGLRVLAIHSDNAAQVR